MSFLPLQKEVGNYRCCSNGDCITKTEVQNRNTVTGVFGLHVCKQHPPFCSFMILISNIQLTSLLYLFQAVAAIWSAIGLRFAAES